MEVIMKHNTSISLGNHFKTFVAEQIDSGRYGSASDVVRAGLRLLEERESKLQALRQAIKEGIESDDVEFSFDELDRELDCAQDTALASKVAR
jgi:antitoxin ParD1/3/4